jgi:hypothetical protein
LLTQIAAGGALAAAAARCHAARAAWALPACACGLHPAPAPHHRHRAKLLLHRILNKVHFFFIDFGAEVDETLERNISNILVLKSAVFFIAK